MKFRTATALREARVDDQARTARVIVLSEGIGNLRDSNWYSPDAVATLVDGLAGVQVYLDHPSAQEEEDRPERSVRDLCGWYSDPQLGTTRDAETGESLACCYATLNFSDAPPGQLALDQVRAALRYQEQFPDSKSVYAGISINAGGMSEEATVGGRRVNAVSEIVDVFSADIVTKPARGGRFLALAESEWGTRRRRKRRESRVPVVQSVLAEAKDITDQVELGAFQDDLERKKSIRRSMGKPDDEVEADVSRYPQPVDAWSTSEALGGAGMSDEVSPDSPQSTTLPGGDEESDDAEGRYVAQGEGEVPRGILSGDPVLHEDEWDGEDGDCSPDVKDADGYCPGDPEYDEETAGVFYLSGYERESAKRRASKRKSEAMKAFEAALGDGMASSDSWVSPDLTAENQDKADPASPAINLRYSVAFDQGRACLFCKHFQPSDPTNPADGGGCALVWGMVRSVDVCNKFSPKAPAEATFDKSYGEDT